MIYLVQTAQYILLLLTYGGHCFPMPQPSHDAAVNANRAEPCVTDDVPSIRSIPLSTHSYLLGVSQ